jgi:hypothetical protein
MRLSTTRLTASAFPLPLASVASARSAAPHSFASRTNSRSTSPARSASLLSRFSRLANSSSTSPTRSCPTESRATSSEPIRDRSKRWREKGVNLALTFAMRETARPARRTAGQCYRRPTASRERQIGEATKRPASRTRQGSSESGHAGVPPWVWIPALVFTSLLLIFVGVAFFVTPELSFDQRWILRTFISFLAGFSACFLSGSALLTMKHNLGPNKNIAFSAAAGMAMLMITYLVPPWFKEQPPVKGLETPAKSNTIPDSIPPAQIVPATTSPRVEAISSKTDKFALGRYALPLVTATFRNHGTTPIALYGVTTTIRWHNAVASAGATSLINPLDRWSIVLPDSGKVEFNASRVVQIAAGDAAAVELLFSGRPIGIDATRDATNDKGEKMVALAPINGIFNVTLTFHFEGGIKVTLPSMDLQSFD